MTTETDNINANLKLWDICLKNIRYIYETRSSTNDSSYSQLTFVLCFKNLFIYNIYLQTIHLQFMDIFFKDSTLNNPQGLICH